MVRPPEVSITARLPAGWILAAVVLVAVTLRPAVTVTSAVLPRIATDVPLTVTEAGVLGSLPPLGFGLAGLVAPLLMRRLAPERVVLVSVLMQVVCFAARPFVPGAPAFLALSAVGLLSIGVANVTLPAVVKVWFPHRVALVTSVYVTVLALGATLAALVAVPVADLAARHGGGTGWRASLLGCALLAALAVVAWLRPAWRPAGRPTRTHTGPRVQVWHSRVAWGITLVFGFNAVVVYSLFAWLPTRLVDAGMPLGTAAVYLTVFAGVGLPTSPLIPLLTARLRNQFVFTAQFVVSLMAGLVGLMLWPTHLTLLWVLLAGWGSCAFPQVMALIGLRSGTPQTAGALSGFAQGLAYGLASLGPVVMGALHDVTGGWVWPFSFVLAATVPMLVGGRLLAGGRTVEEDLAVRRPAAPVPAG